MNLFDNEDILLTTDGNLVTLTTHRIRYNAGSSGDTELTSIMLEKMSSVKLNSRRYPILLIIGLLLILIGIGVGINGHSNNPVIEIILPTIAGTIICVLYFFTRQHTCIISSDGGSKIVFSTTNMKREALVNFIDKVEKAKFNRVSRIAH